MRFQDKVALVTGGANGIGRATAAQLLAEGARVVLMDRDEAQLVETAANLGAHPAVGDVSVRTDVQRAVQLCTDAFGRLDILIANAGVSPTRPLMEMDDDRWRRALEVNLTGIFLCVQEAARAMTAGGAIVVTSSTNSFYVEYDHAAYNASKGGGVAFVRSAAIELSPLGIRVNAVQPGVVNTSFAAGLIDNPEWTAEYCKYIPLKRFAEPDEIARAILFLASDDASYITGQGLILDGGLTLGILIEMPKKK